MHDEQFELSVIGTDDFDAELYRNLYRSRFKASIRPLASFQDRIEDYINRGITTGDQLPWGKGWADIQFRPGEVTLWGGYNGHGKSQILGQVMLWVMEQSKVVIASMEMSVESQAVRMMRQASGSAMPSKRFRTWFMASTVSQLALLDEQASLTPDFMEGFIAYCGMELGARHIVIDSLVKCGIAQDGVGHLTAQTRFMDMVCAQAKAHHLHIHVVHHVRKSESEEKAPDKMDFRGAGQITDLVDNVIICHRNKKKERLVQMGELVESNVPDATLNVCKQRHGEWEGRIGVWFHRESQQFTNREGEVMRWTWEGTQPSFYHS